MMSSTSRLTDGPCSPVKILLDGKRISDSPTNSDTDSDGSDSSGSSDSTIEDVEVYPRLGLGHPLERMVPVDSSDESSALNPGLKESWRNSFASEFSESSASTSSSFVYDIDYETLVDDLLKENPSLSASRKLTMVEPSDATCNESIVLKCLPKDSAELFLLLELNHAELRQDPWNPIPHILCAVERGEHVFLCMQRLTEYNRPPFKTVANYIDFFRQALEALTFLHELEIARLSFRDPYAFMVDVGAGTAVDQFDRTRFPVKYYHTNLSKAIKCTSSSDVFAKDVQDCGSMIDRMLAYVPPICPKFKSLVKSMASGSFTADNSRKLFEALCKSLESSVFDTPVPEAILDMESGSQYRYPRAGLARSRSHPPSLRNLALRDEGASTATLVPARFIRTTSQS